MGKTCQVDKCRVTMCQYPYVCINKQSYVACACPPNQPDCDVPLKPWHGLLAAGILAILIIIIIIAVVVYRGKKKR